LFGTTYKKDASLEDPPTAVGGLFGTAYKKDPSLEDPQRQLGDYSAET